MRMSTQPHSSTSHNGRDTKPWYRYGLAWFVIGIPVSSIITGSIFIWISFSQADSLVADDYYKQGRGINQRLEKDQAAADRGITITPTIRAQANGSQRIEVRFTAHAGTATPALLRLRLSHPTLDQKDILATLVKSGSGLYRSDVPGISAGRWYVQLEDENSEWRVRSVWIVE
jgi:uncharacterized protein